MGEGQQPTDTPDNGAVDGSTPSDGARKGENGGVSSTERTGDGDVHTSTPGYDDEDEEDDMDARGGRAHKKSSEVRRECPYLDTVNRQVLDFDFEKFCSVSLSNLNVYGCLVCGKYFQGRSRGTHAVTHALEVGHHVFINLRTEKVYCLPDGYEVDDPSLDDIRSVLNPRFRPEQLPLIDKSKQWSRTLDGTDYMPGMVGLNNIKDTDFVNVVIQSLMRVTPLRDFFLLTANYTPQGAAASVARAPSVLLQRFGELTRKVWHARNFKGQVSPHEFLQAVMMASNKRFRIGQKSDPVEFLSWLLNQLNADLVAYYKKQGAASNAKNTIIHQCFQGELEVVKETPRSDTKKVEEKEDEDAGKKRSREEMEGKEEEKGGDEQADKKYDRTVSRMPFLMLGMDLPPPPLFKDVMEKNIIPQVPLFNILKKFDGETVTEVVRPQVARMHYRITKLPKYLILHMKRFKKNNFFVEKNPTLVNFPVRNLELKDYIPLTALKGDRLRSKYDLVANIVHDGRPGEGSHRVFVQRKSEDQWYEMQDLHVTETLPQIVALSEAYIQIYEQQG